MRERRHGDVASRRPASVASRDSSAQRPSHRTAARSPLCGSRSITSSAISSAVGRSTAGTEQHSP
jgi:hypothetical protein